MRQLIDVMYGIIDNNLFHYYIFTGDETEVMRIYVDKICELGYDRVTCEDVATALRQNGAMSLLGKPKCFVVYDDAEYAKEDKHWETVKEKFEKSKNILILVYHKLDKRSKISKTEELTTFDKLNDNLLIKYILKIFPHFDIDLAQELVHICENDYSRILLECDKIQCYLKANTELKTPDEAFKQLLQQGAIYQPIVDITFKFTDAVLYGDLENSYKLLEQIKLKGESTLGILSLLYTNFKNMLLYQGLGKDKSDAERRTGLQYWQISNVKKVIGGYKTIELRNILSTITAVEEGIKTGNIEEALALDYAIIKIMG